MAVAAEPGLELEPDLDRALELARDANVIPIAYRFIEDRETPVSAFLKLRGAGPAFLLESAEQGRMGRYSFIGVEPRAVLRWSDGVLGEWTGEAIDAAARACAWDAPTTSREAPDPYAAVSEALARYRVAEVEGLPPFAGGAVGFFGYDPVRTVEPLGEPNPDPLGLPDMALMITEAMLVFDHLRHELTILACAFVEDDGGVDAAYEEAAATIAEMRERLRAAV